MAATQTITFSVQKPEAKAIIEAIPPDELNTTLEDYIVLADRVLRTVRISERDALSEIFDRFENIQQRLDMAVGQLSKSQTIGAIGEAQVLLDFNTAFGPADKFEPVGHSAFVGDILGRLSNGEKVLIEVKKYRDTVPRREVDKFWRDMRENNYSYGLFVSLQSTISGLPTENFAYRQDGPRRAVFVVNTAFDNIGHRMGLEYLKRLIELERLSAMAASRADIVASVGQIADQLNHIRDNLNLATDIQTTAQATVNTIQENMTRVTERVIELRVRVKHSLESIDGILAALQGQEWHPPANDPNWVAMLDLLDDDHKLSTPLRTICAGMISYKLQFQPGTDNKHLILREGQEVGCLHLMKSKLNVLTNMPVDAAGSADPWLPTKSNSGYRWRIEINNQAQASQYIFDVARFLAGMS